MTSGLTKGSVGTDDQPKRQIRADAKKNEDAILEAAKSLFSSSGVDASMRQIAAKAGVGIGTIYRRFPTRADLIAGVFRREVDSCAAEAVSLSSKYSPWDALERWITCYTQFIATKKGLAAALYSGDPAYDTLPDYFRTNFEPALTSLLDSAVKAGEIRADIAPYDLLRAISNLCVADSGDIDNHTGNMVGLLIDGLRYPGK